MAAKPRTNFYLDVILFILMVIVLVSGLVLWVDGGEGQHRGGGWPNAGGNDAEQTLLLSRQDWKTLHLWLGLAVGVIILVHLVFHWKWIVCRLRADVLGQKPGQPMHSPVCRE
jgi:cytochrome b561